MHSAFTPVILGHVHQFVHGQQVYARVPTLNPRRSAHSPDDGPGSQSIHTGLLSSIRTAACAKSCTSLSIAMSHKFLTNPAPLGAWLNRS